ncbi:MAG: ATP synthase F1 subunit epsilon [Pseudanabaenaceae cyanobacterium bins.68]|nr:ATP synthase F1 subunit epsilon [Pseudanabaenaceae cyanobacterium bins.68]
MTLAVKVISPDQTVLDVEAEEIILPSTTGQLGILTDHAPLLTALEIGVMRYYQNKSWQAIALMGGFAEIEQNEVTVLVNSAELSSSIDPAIAKQELSAAEQALNQVKAEDKQGKIMAETQLRRARARFQATVAS